MSLSTIFDNLYSELSGYAGLQSLLANSDSPVTYRIDPVQRGHVADTPFLTYEQISDTPFNVLNNAGGGGKRQVRIQLDALSKTHVAAVNLAEQARLAMRDATTFTSSYQNTSETYYPDVKLYSVITQYLVITT